MSDSIIEFSGKYRFLSNFYIVKGGVYYEGRHYKSSEHAYQAAKTLNIKVRREIANASTPGRAKRLGRRILLRDGWYEEIRRQAMYDIVRIKFKNEGLRHGLLLTGDAHLEEGNTWGDVYWGTENGHGENHLGKILMQVRKEIIRNA